MLGVALVIVLVVAVAVSLVIWIRRAASCRRIIGAADTEPEAKFPGGVLCRYVITSGSLARLEIHDWGVRLRGIAVSKWIVPTWEARYEELAIAERVTLRYSRIAVWLKLRGAPDGMGFLTDFNTDILAKLEQHGVPVNRVVSQVGRVEELYHS